MSTILPERATYKGELPQGWRPSGYIANLVFWDREPGLVQALENEGYQYSRFMDDVTVSAKFCIRDKQKSQILSRIYGTLYSKGYKPNRKKHEIVCSSKAMIVTSLNVNGKRPTVTASYRNNVRAMVFQLEEKYPSIGQGWAYYKEWRSVYGRVCRVKSFHDKKGGDLQIRMNAVKPPKKYFSKKSSGESLACPLLAKSE